MVSEVVGRLVRQFDPDRILLFGSRARGDARADSNYDLLVVLPRVGNKHKTLVAMLRAVADLPVDVNVIPTDPGEIRAEEICLETCLALPFERGRCSMSGHADMGALNVFGWLRSRQHVAVPIGLLVCMLAIRVARDQGAIGPRAFTLAWFLLISAWGVACALYGGRLYHAYRAGVVGGFGESVTNVVAPLDDASATWLMRIMGIGLAVAFLIRFFIALPHP